MSRIEGRAAPDALLTPAHVARVDNSASLEPAVRQRRQLAPNVRQQVHLYRADREPLSVRSARHHQPPGIDQHRLPKGDPPLRMPTVLRWGEHVALILNRPRAQKDFPVILP